LGEVGTYGAGASCAALTPRLEQLAPSGMRFSNFNIEFECAPSRSALMTGRHPVRSGMWRAVDPGLSGTERDKFGLTTVYLSEHYLEGVR
jgi:arylsulfatase A-like enzyme